MLKESFALSFAQVGLLTLTLQVTASLLQPLVGLYTDRRPTPYSLGIGMTFSLVGLLLLAAAATYRAVLAAAALMGIGSSIFHPEASRVARMASGGRHGLAQSLFQVGGNLGSSFGPLLGAFLVAPRGQRSIAWCSLLAALAMIVLWRVGAWYRAQHAESSRLAAASRRSSTRDISDPAVAWPLGILGALIFSKYLYLAGLNSYYTFFLITKFHLSVRAAQIDLFIF